MMPTPQATYRDTALQYHTWGMNVLALDRAALLAGTKKPCHYWKGKPGEILRDGTPKPNWTVTPQSSDDVLGFPWHKAGGVAVANGFNGTRTIDVDDCADPADVIRRINIAMDLDPEYRHSGVSGSGTGARITVFCHEELDARIAPSGVLSLAPRIAGDFDHIELRMRNTITVLPPSEHKSGKTYRYLFGEPDGPPAVVTRDQLLAGILAVASLPEPKPAPEPRPVARTTPRDTSPDANYKRIIDRVNAESPESYLRSKGSEQRRDGNLSCPCGVHKGDGQLTIGHSGVYCHSTNPACPLVQWAASHKPSFDRWQLEVCLEYRGDTKAALIAHGWQPPEPAVKVESPYPARSDAARRAESAERAERRRRAAERQRTTMTARATAYELPERAHIALDALAQIAHGLDTIRPSIARLVRDTGMCERRVIRALNDLEGICLSTEEHTSPNGNAYRGGGQQTAKRTFLDEPLLSIAEAKARRQGVTMCAGCACPENAQVSPKIDLVRDLISEDLLACERPPAPPQHEHACDFDTWAPGEDCHGADERGELEIPHGAVFAEPLAPVVRHSAPFGWYIWYPDGRASAPYATKQEAQNDCAEIAIRAARAAGRIIPEAFPQGGDQRSNSPRVSLIDAGISHNQSVKWQKLASCWRKPGFDDTDQPESATYGAPAITNAPHEMPAWARVDIGPTPMLDLAAPPPASAQPIESGPRDPARIADPTLKDRYYGLVGRAKKAVSPKQAKWFRDEAARILNGAELLPMGQARPAPDSPPLTSLPAGRRPQAPVEAEQASLWRGGGGSARNAPTTDQRGMDAGGVAHAISERMRSRGTLRVLSEAELLRDNPDTTFSSFTGTPVDMEAAHV
jgi:Bifunctional DNA primase/polymerase, N-terminal